MLDESSGEESDSSSDEDDLEMLLLQNLFSSRELCAHLNFMDINDDDFESLFR